MSGMSVLPVYTYGAPVLRKKARPVTAVTPETIKFIMDMFQTMHGAQGIGLAATQVGSLDRIIVVDISDLDDYKDVKPMTLINPEVVAEEGLRTMEEGCLSIPDVRDDVERADSITVRYRDAAFKEITIEASGILARVLLHEIDHLNGVLFIDRLTDARKKLHRDALKEIQRGEMDVSYPVVTAADVTA
jgi:peptide deformylase